MYTGILRTIYTFSLLAIAISIVPMAFHHGDMMKGEKKGVHHEKMMETHQTQEVGEDTTKMMETIEMQTKQITELQQVAQQNIMAGDNLTFFLQKTLEKNYTEEEMEAMVVEYQDSVKKREAEYNAQMEAAQNEANTPVVAPAAE